MIDVHTYIGGYPFRELPHPDPDVLVRVLAREGLTSAWVGHLPSAFHRDPAPGNDALFASLEPHAGTLVAIPVVRPDWPRWERALAAAVDRGVPAVRAYPTQWGLGADDPSMRLLRDACGEAGVAIVLTTRFEDLRQRHWLDAAGDLSAAAVRGVARGNRRTRIVVLAAGREMIEEVHWGLTPEERALVWWDISWIWGPPEDHLSHLFRTVGSDRFVRGSGWPLRLAQTPRANLALLPDDLLDIALANPEDWT
jgi:predicted TIM-barrel fold metal-dependent hydrolase